MHNTIESAGLHLIALGANLPTESGAPRETLEAAVAALGAAGLALAARSPGYATPADPAGSGPDFVNGAIAVRAALAPERVLGILHDVEARLGRERPHRWAPRVCDLDLIASEGTVLPDAETWRHWAGLPAERQQTEAPGMLVLPHPRLQERGFVLRPLADIAPGWRHPVLGRTVREMLEALPADEIVTIRQI